MPETLLLTKLFIPPLRPNLVRRPHLIKRLDQGLQTGHKMTLISAPAGFGKTTLVGEWAGKLRQTESAEGQALHGIAWLSLDEGDNDLTRFLTYVVATLSQIDGLETRIGKGAKSMLELPQPPRSEPVLISLINDMTTISRQIVLFFDDYHLIDSTAVDDALNFLLEHLPEQLHIVVATRDDPNLPTARLRAQGELTELRAIDLRFSLAEATEFLNQVMDLNLALEEIVTLDSRTEGWIAGLQLAAISMQGRDDYTGLIKSFTGSNRFVLDYLMEEVLDRQSDSVQSFLLQTAVLDRLSGALCDVLTGLEDSQATLEMLEHANLFIMPLDGKRLWYRYHHLFADLLRQRLRQSRPDSVSQLHIKAGEWFSQQGLNREAIKHLLAAHDYHGAANLIEAIAIDIMQQGEHTAVMHWIDTLPDALIKEQPYLCVLHAWALQLTGQLEAAESRLLDAEDALRSPKYEANGNTATIRGLIHSHRAYLAFMVGEQQQTIDHAQQALQQLPQTAVLIRTQTALYQGVAYRFQGQFQAASEIYNEILPVANNLGGRSVAVLGYLHLADLHWQLAQLHRVYELCQQALELTERNTGRSDLPFTGFVYVRIGRVLRQWNHLQDAYNFTKKGLSLCRDWNVADILALSCIEMAYISQALGKEEQAQDAIQEAIQIYSSFSPWGIQYAEAYRVKMDLQRGETAAAEKWAQAVDLDLEGDFEFHRENEYLLLARVFLAQKRFAQAQRVVQKMMAIAQESGERRTELEGLILMALIFAAQKAADQAIVHLSKALTLAEPQGFVRIFVDEGRPMAHLLYQALSRGIAPQYIPQLLAAFDLAPLERANPLEEEISQVGMVEPLSDRELEVLQLIAEGLSNPQIALRLYLSLNTVKVHSRNIYGKLDVHSRTQAVSKARALGILP
ncbi:MAG: LuxR C-terminal-related transcriptional regulator [Candidatus Promineifilaceae bacterium]|nr:LuxR C-terminal-related transcriptional regulator [Candidatus Promineifilaceae bacterium]